MSGGFDGTGWTMGALVGEGAADGCASRWAGRWRGRLLRQRRRRRRRACGRRFRNRRRLRRGWSSRSQEPRGRDDQGASDRRGQNFRLHAAGGDGEPSSDRVGLAIAPAHAMRMAAATSDSLLLAGGLTASPSSESSVSTSVSSSSIRGIVSDRRSASVPHVTIASTLSALFLDAPPSRAGPAGPRNETSA